MTTRTVHAGGLGDHLSIQAAVTACVAEGDVVRVLDSATYNEAVDLTNGMGGGWGRSVTFEVEPGESPTWDGTSFNLPALKGWSLQSGNPCTVPISGFNFTNWNATFGYGSGVLFAAGRVIYQVDDCTFTDCNGITINYGHGIAAAHQRLNRCKWRNCTDMLFQNGGNYYIDVTNCDFYGKHNGAGITSSALDVVVKHCTFYLRAGIGQKGIVAGVVENTIVRNAGGYGGWVGIEVVAGGSRSNNCITGTWSVVQQGGTSGGGDVFDDPLFVSEADPDPDLSLQAASPCRDAGKDAGITVDFNGTARPQDAGYDMGAFEFYVPPPEPEPEPEPMAAPDPQPYEITGCAERLVSKLPTGLVPDADARDFWKSVFEVLCLPGVVLRRKLRVVPEQYDGRTAEPQMLDWLLAQVGLDASQPVVGLLSETAKRTLARQAPALFSSRGAREAIRAAARRGGPFPAFFVDWFDLQTVVDVSALPLIMAPDPLGGAYESQIHVAEGALDTPTDRDLVQELVRLNLPLCEVATMRYVLVFDNGQNGVGQWAPSGVFSAPSEPPFYLRAAYLPGQAWNTVLQANARNYAAWFAVTPVESTSYPRMWVYADPDTAMGYNFKIQPVGGSGLWELRGPGLLASGALASFVDGSTYLVQITLYNAADGVHIAVFVDGDPLCDVTDATNFRTAGTIGFDTQNADTDLEFVHVHVPGLTDESVVEHHSVIK